MLRLLRFLLTGDFHLHKWETISNKRCEGDYGTWTRYYVRCIHCGIIKKIDA